MEKSMDRKTDQAPLNRKFPIPERVRSQIYALMPDGTRVEVSALEAYIQAQMWLEAVAGANVYRENEIKPE